MVKKGRVTRVCWERAPKRLDHTVNAHSIIHLLDASNFHPTETSPNLLRLQASSARKSDRDSLHWYRSELALLMKLPFVTY